MKIEDNINKPSDEQNGASEPFEDIPGRQIPFEGPTGGIRMDFSFLLAETGAGSVEDYMDDPLNFKKSVGLAQIIRGLHGFGAKTNLAVIDVIFGALRFSKERSPANVHPQAPYQL